MIRNLNSQYTSAVISKLSHFSFIKILPAILILGFAPSESDSDVLGTDTPAGKEKFWPDASIRWRFHKQDEADVWTVPESLRPQVRGGCLQIRSWRHTQKNQLLVYARPRPEWTPLISSPDRLGLEQKRSAKLYLRLLNRSPETDIRVWFTTDIDPENKLGPVSIPMKPYESNWQSLTGHLDDISWEGSLDQIFLQFPCGQAGDIFIWEIALGPGEPRVHANKPDVLGQLPVVKVPGITQEDVNEAFSVLSDAVVYDGLPINGFPVPFLAPGAEGAFYGKNWWVLDASLAMHPLLWTAPEFCETMMVGFCDILDANPDGCMQHEGKIASRGIPCSVSVIPRVFEAWYAIAQNTQNEDLRLRIYKSMARHLSWWLSPVKREEKTGLVWNGFEETFTYHQRDFIPGHMAAVDNNVAVAVGARLCADLARDLGLKSEILLHERQFEEQAETINKWLWNEELGCYLNYILREDKHRVILASHMFDPLRFAIAPPERRERLYERLFDPEQFGWGRYGLTTVARQDPKFVIRTGSYGGSAWNGDVWTMRNHPIIQGLRESGERRKAAELAWHTLEIFKGQYAEFLEPDEGTPHGVKRYSWTAGQWLQILFEEIFGLQWHGSSNTLVLDPMVPDDLAGIPLEIWGLKLPDQHRTPINVRIWLDEDGMMHWELPETDLPKNYQVIGEGRDKYHLGMSE